MQLPVVKSDIQLRYSDIDSLNHVSNIVYSSYLEMSRVEWFLSIPGKLVPSVVANLNITFLGEIKYGDKVHVITRCTKVGTKSIRLYQEIHANGTCVTTAETTLVGFDPATRTTVPLLTGWEPSPAG